MILPPVLMNKTTNLPVSQWRVPPGKSSRPTPKLLYRLAGPVRWYRKTIVHIAVTEACKLPLRILAMSKKSYPRFGVRLPCDPRPIGFSIAFERACNAGIQRLQQESPWCDHLDLELYAQGFLQGAKYLLDSVRKEGGNRALQDEL
jgi:hypothetical protein